MTAHYGITIDIKEKPPEDQKEITYPSGESSDQVRLTKSEDPKDSGFFKFTHTKNGNNEQPFRVSQIKYAQEKVPDIGINENIKHLTVWYWDKDTSMDKPLLIEMLDREGNYKYHVSKGDWNEWSPLSRNPRPNPLIGNDLEAKLDHLNCYLNQAVTITLTFEHSNKLSDSRTNGGGTANKYCCDYHNPRGDGQGRIPVIKGTVPVASRVEYYKHTITSSRLRLAKIKYHITKGDGQWRRIKSGDLSFPTSNVRSVYALYCNQNPELIYIEGNGSNGTNKWYKKPNSRSNNNGNEQWTPVLPDLQNTAPENITDCTNFNKLKGVLSCARGAKCTAVSETKVSFEPSLSSSQKVTGAGHQGPVASVDTYRDTADGTTTQPSEESGDESHFERFTGAEAGFIGTIAGYFFAGTAGSGATFFGGWKLYNKFKGDPWVRQI